MNEIEATVLATSLATTFANKAIEKIGENAGENLLETAKGLVKSLFKPEEMITLNLSADHLSEPVAQKTLIRKLENGLMNNPDVAQQLQTLLESLKEQSSGGRTTYIETLKGYYFEKNEGEINQTIS